MKKNNKKYEKEYLLSLKKALFIGTLGITTAISSACGSNKGKQVNPFPVNKEVHMSDYYDLDSLKFEEYEDATFVSKTGEVEAYSELLEDCKNNINNNDAYGTNKSLYKIGRVILQKKVAEALNISITDMESFSVEYKNITSGENNPCYVTVGYNGEKHNVELEGQIGREIDWCINKAVNNSISFDDTAYTDVDRVIESYKACLYSKGYYSINNGKVNNSSIEKVGNIIFGKVKNKTKSRN